MAEQLRVLLTNDDGIEHPGLERLYERSPSRLQ